MRDGNGIWRKTKNSSIACNIKVLHYIIVMKMNDIIYIIKAIFEKPYKSTQTVDT